MGNTIGSISIDLTANIAQFTSDLGRASRVAQQQAQAAQQRAQEFGEAIGKTIRAGAIAAAAAFTATAVAVKKTIDNMDELSKASQKVGLSTESFSTLAFAAKLSNVGVDDLATAMGRLSKAQGDALKNGSTQQRLFDALGISVKNASGQLRSSEDVLKDFADRFKQLKGSPEAIAAGMNIFGRSFQTLIPLLKDGAAGISDAQAEAAALGLQLNGDSAKAAERFNDDLTRLQGAIQGIVMTVTTNLLPTLTDWTDKAVGLAKDHDRLKSASDGLTSTLESLAVIGHTVAIAFYAIEGAVKTVTTGVATGVTAISAQASLLKSLATFDGEGVKESWRKFGIATTVGKEQAVEAFSDAEKKIGASVAAISKIVNGDPWKDVSGGVLGKPEAAGAAADAAKRAAAVRAALANAGSGGSKSDGVDKLAKAYAALYEEVQKVNAANDPIAKIQQDYAGKIQGIAKLGAAVIKAGGDVAATQKAVGDGAAALNKQMKFDLDAPTRAVKEYTEALDAQLRAQQQNIDVRVQAIGLGDKEAANMEELARVQFEGAEAVRRLTEAHQLNPNESGEQFAGKLKALQAYWSDYYDATKQGQQRIDAARSDWHAGVNAAVQNFMDEQRNQYQQAKQFTADFIGGSADAFAKFASGAETAKQAFGSLLDSMYQQALKFVANKAIQALFDSFGNKSGGESSGGGWGGILSNLVGAFGGSAGPGTIGAGLASGGPVMPGSFHRVNENGPELYTQGGNSYLMGGSQPGNVVPIRAGAGGNTFVTNVNVQPTSSRRTADQVATEVARKQRTAMSRNG